MSTLERLRLHIQDLPDSRPIVAKFLHHLGSPEDVDGALETLVEQGFLLRATLGVFGKPNTSEWGTGLGFGAWEAAKAYCENEGWVMGLIPAEWANAVHLSTQVVAVSAYYTDGPTRDVRFGERRTLHFTHASPRDMRLTQTVGGGALLGLEWVRPQYSLIAIRQLARDLPQEHFAAFLMEARQEGGWINLAVHAFENAYGDSAGQDGMDLDSEGCFERMERAFTDQFRRHETLRDLRLEEVKRHLAPNAPTDGGIAHED